MTFRTKIPSHNNSTLSTDRQDPLSVRNQIDYDSKLLLIGSCFSENIGDKLAYFKFQNSVNPFGILFHPKAIENLITNSINLKKYTDKDVFFHNERWHCYEAHSELSDPSKEKLLQKLSAAINSTFKQINNASHIVITLGTAWAYREITTDHIVANCHKVPQKKFLKELLTIDEISENLETITTLIKNVNPAVQFIFTVSPVRHLKDGFTENTLSKAHLLSAIHQVLKENSSLSGVEGYFPSYEIMMDDLRDYRFYKEDMIHPNETAITYIWEEFKKTWIADSAIPVMEKIDTIQKGLLHRPFNENSDQHQKFLTNLQVKMDSLKEDYNIAF